MKMKLVDQTGELPVSLQELKANSRITHDDEDVILNVYLEAAIETVQQASGLVLIAGVYEVTLPDWWHDHLCIRISPVNDVVSVKYFDINGAEQEVLSSNFNWLFAGSTFSLWLNSSFYAPRTMDNNAAAVSVRIHAGYLTESDSGYEPELKMPVRAKQAVLMIASHWYEHREAVVQGAMMKVPQAYQYLIDQLKTYA